MEADRFSVRVREHDGTYLGAIFGDRDTLMDEHVHDYDTWSLRYPGTALFHGYERRYCACGAFQSRRIAELIDAALASHDARVTA